VPLRVTYWTGTWNPHAEGTSKEISMLRRALMPRSPIVAFSPGNRSHVAWRERVITLSARRPALLRGVAACVEPLGDISHVFGGLDSWFLLRAVGCRPTILTAVADGIRLEERLYRHITAYVAESPELVRSLIGEGVPPDLIRLIYPATDLSAFTPAPAPHGPFRILFASWPEHPEQLEKRGVLLLVELARRCPKVEVVLLVRQWGDQGGTNKVLELADVPANVKVETLRGRSMAEVYASVHVVAALFEKGSGKSSPNSIIEGLACGRPALVSTDCGIASTVANRAGVVVQRHVDALTVGVELVRSSWPALSRQARELAEEKFSEAAFLRQYRDLYEQIGK
jgi:glycosyltransferase involved in cell wall biosynthesis